MNKTLVSVSVDFDGTITKAPHYGDLGYNELRPECKEVMNALYPLGVTFRLLTGRQEEYLQEALDLCRAWDLPIDLSSPTRKTITDFYIDDKNLGCLGIDWGSVYRILYAEVKARLDLEA